MLSLYIGWRKGVIEDINGRRFTVLPLYYEKGDDIFELRQATDLPPLDDVGILVVVWRAWKHFVRLPVTPKLRAAILNFMIFKHLPQDDFFDCYSFVCWYAGVPLESGYRSHWRHTPLGWPRRGDVVFLFSSPGKPRRFHAAIYLGFGVYLSVLGGGGRLEVMTLEDMEKDFGTDKIVRAIPR